MFGTEFGRLWQNTLALLVVMRFDFLFFFMSTHPSKNRTVAIQSIDSLRLLSVKFLAIDELASYNFQSDFMKPFEKVSQGSSRSVRMHVVESLAMLVNGLPKNLKSGWKSILRVLALQVPTRPV